MLQPVTHRSLIACLGLVCTCFSPLHARDVNLDAVYIRTGSPQYERLLEKKLEAYGAANSRCVDRDVAYAVWLDGFTIAYVREVRDLNIICTYNRATRQSGELHRMTGTITAFRAGASGRHLFIKRMTAGDGREMRGERVLIDTKRKRVASFSSAYPFIDFSVIPGTDSIAYQESGGIVEYNPDTGGTSILVKKNDYAGIVLQGAPVIAYLSPNRNKMLMVSGSGGSYRAMMRAAGRSWQVRGITSASEISWLDNDLLAFRQGETGNYSVVLYRPADKKSRILAANSLNTNIQFSFYPRMLAFLRDQMIQVYDVRLQKSVRTGLEGEDVLFTPDGNWFISLFLKKLFITNINSVKKKRMDIVKVSGQIRAIYRTLLDTGTDFSNEYSPAYARRKISGYQTFIESE